jgi:hypothetical protein
MGGKPPATPLNGDEDADKGAAPLSVSNKIYFITNNNGSHPQGHGKLLCRLPSCMYNRLPLFL